MKLDRPFVRLPLQFDAATLAAEAGQFAEHEWRKHPQGHAGNTGIPLVSVDGVSGSDEVCGPMRPTAELDRCPYIRSVLGAFDSPIGRTRFMRIQGHGEATAHVDTNYYWMQRVRIHIPVLTYPEVEFLCGGESVHMPAGSCWIFDTWRLHNVLNHNDKPRIHLVVDTVGSPYFWSLVDVGRSGDAHAATSLAGIDRRSHKPLEFESSNYPLTMTPWEVECLLGALADDFDRSGPADRVMRTEMLLHAFLAEWRSLWSTYGASAAGDPHYRVALANLDRRLLDAACGLKLVNNVDAIEAVRQAVVRVALNPKLRERETTVVGTAVGQAESLPPTLAFLHQGGGDRSAGEGLPAVAKSVAEPKSEKTTLERPVFILAAPRSGSTLLFETLAKASGVYTIGGESHDVFERHETLKPAARGWESNRLTAANATPDIVAALHEEFLRRAKVCEGKSPAAGQSVRLLEKTPKNALRVPFLLAAFPDALFVHLQREPQPNLASIVEAWQSGKFVTYPKLPDWTGSPWSLLLIPGWQNLVGKPLAEIAAQQYVAAHRAILDDLANVPAARIASVSYEAFLADPQAEALRLCAFAGWDWNAAPLTELPHSRVTLTAPDPNKWRKHEAEIARVADAAVAIHAQTKARAMQNTAAPQAPAVAATGAATDSTKAADPADPLTHPLRSSHTASFPAILGELGASLFVSTYQAGKVVIVRAEGDHLNTHFRAMPSPMGIARDGDRLAIGSLHQVVEFLDQPEVTGKLEPKGKHDAIFLPRTARFTGDIRIHEIAFAGDGELWVVNTRFSCLATLDDRYSFVPRWRPNFVSALAAEDRCHLNGLAMRDGKPRYVTALGRTDDAAGWRSNKRSGGILMDVPSQEVLLEGLSMPHSPRWREGKLWMLESGRGALSTVDFERGRLDAVAELPGFTRGVDFCGHYAFVGLSQVRESAVFAGLPITEEGKTRECGVWIVDLRTGALAGFLRFEDGVQEIFAVQVLPNKRWPEIVIDDRDVLGGSFVLPPAALKDLPQARAA